MRNLLALQELDKKINACKEREVEIPKQKSKFDIHRKRLQNELAEREDTLTKLTLEQKECEGGIEQHQVQIQRYNEQLNTIKKNEEYQALLHEIEREKKQIAVREEQIIAILIELDESKETLDEDKKRIRSETEGIDSECAIIDDELKVAVQHRMELDDERAPIISNVTNALMARYDRLCRNYKMGPVVVPINGEVCTGCHMHILAQVTNEVMAGNKVHGCQHCGRLLYYPPNFENAEVAPSET
ncbi:MAG: C4-type zinc ribbon domain-containing protein [Candidatus Hydrogenedentota bacterium]